MPATELAEYAGLLVEGEAVDGGFNNRPVPAEFFAFLCEMVAAYPRRQMLIRAAKLPSVVVCNYCRAVACIVVEGGGRVQKLRRPPAVGFTLRNRTYSGTPVEISQTSASDWRDGTADTVWGCPASGKLMDDLTDEKGNFPKVRVHLVDK